MNLAKTPIPNWLVERGRKMVDAGRARSVVVKRGQKVLLRVPLLTGAAGLVPAALLAPEITALATTAAVLARCTVEVVQTTDRSSS